MIASPGLLVRYPAPAPSAARRGSETGSHPSRLLLAPLWATGLGQLRAVLHVHVPHVVFLAEDLHRAPADHVILHFLGRRRLRQSETDGKPLLRSTWLRL